MVRATAAYSAFARSSSAAQRAWRAGQAMSVRSCALHSAGMRCRAAVIVAVSKGVIVTSDGAKFGLFTLVPGLKIAENAFCVLPANYAPHRTGVSPGRSASFL